MPNLYRLIANRILEKNKRIEERNNHIIELVELGNNIFISYTSFIQSVASISGETAFITDFRYDNNESVSLYGLPVGEDRHLHFNITTTTTQAGPTGEPEFRSVKVEIFKELDVFFVNVGLEDCVLLQFSSSQSEEYLTKIAFVIDRFFKAMRLVKTPL